MSSPVPRKNKKLTQRKSNLQGRQVHLSPHKEGNLKGQVIIFLLYKGSHELASGRLVKTGVEKAGGEHRATHRLL